MDALPEDYLLLQELVSEAKRRLTPETWDYLVGGAETETTLRRNRQALDSIAFRPRVLRDVSAVDCSAELLGLRLRLPLLLAPIGSLQDLDPGGGATAARAATAFGVMQMQSSNGAPGLEATAAAAPGPKIFQLYVRGDAAFVDDHVRRAADAGYHAFCLTVDTDHYSRRERDLARRYVTTARRGVRGESHQARFSWEDVARVRELCRIPLLLKGIATAEDARLAIEHGIDGVYVSNHGGRQLDHGRGALEMLPEVVSAVKRRAAVLVDGGICRGTDLVKAMALGADGVGIGRLFGYAIAAGGCEAVVRMLEILEHEVTVCLGLLGVTGFHELDASYLHPASPVRPAHVLSAFPLLEEGD